MNDDCGGMQIPISEAILARNLLPKKHREKQSANSRRREVRYQF